MQNHKEAQRCAVEVQLQLKIQALGDTHRVKLAVRGCKGASKLSIPS